MHRTDTVAEVGNHHVSNMIRTWINNNQDMAEVHFAWRAKPQNPVDTEPSFAKSSAKCIEKKCQALHRMNADKATLGVRDARSTPCLING